MKRVIFALLLISSSAKASLTSAERTTLANGLEVIMVPRKSVPSVQLSLAIKAGSNADPLDKSGLADFTAEMLRKGTLKRNAQQIAETLDFAAVTLAATTSDDSTVISCQARTKDLNVCLEILTDVVQNPSFPEDQIGLMRQRYAASIESSKDSPGELAGQHAVNLYFGDDDTRGRSVSHVSLSKVDRNGMIDFHRRWYAPNNAVLAVSGDFDAAMVKNAFAAWPKHEVPKADDFKKIGVSPLKIRLVDKPDATQSNIVITGPGIAHADKDFYATMLMNYTLGGGSFSSRLMKVIRSEGGKTYSANSGFQAGLLTGPFSVSTFTRNSETGATLQLLFGEIEKMRKSGVTDEELKAAKGNVIGGFGLRLETSSSLAGRLLQSTIHGLATDYLDTYTRKMESVTRADVNKAAADHLTPTALVVVGNAKEVVPLLEKLGLKVDETVHYLAPISKSERQ